MFSGTFQYSESEFTRKYQLTIHNLKCETWKRNVPVHVLSNFKSSTTQESYKANEVNDRPNTTLKLVSPKAMIEKCCTCIKIEFVKFEKNFFSERVANVQVKRV